MSFRVNYGNGQVSKVFRRRSAALDELADALKSSPGAFVQFWDHGSADAPGDWFTDSGARRDLQDRGAR